MRIPDHVYLGGIRIPVLIKYEGMDDAFGYYKSNEHEIWINGNFPIDIQHSTFIHELIEAIDTMWELKLKHSQIVALENGLYQAFTSSRQ